MPGASSRGRSPPICRSCSRPNSNWLSISRRPGRLTWKFRPRCVRAPKSVSSEQDGIGNVTKVLYVEHNDDNLYMLKTRLELRGGFEVLAAENSEKGCRLAATEHPDVILMDLEMPDDDRWEAVRRLKNSPQTR